MCGDEGPTRWQTDLQVKTVTQHYTNDGRHHYEIVHKVPVTIREEEWGWGRGSKWYSSIGYSTVPVFNLISLGVHFVLNQSATRQGKTKKGGHNLL